MPEREERGKASDRINRNIVECKDSLVGQPQKRISSINRNIVECKVSISGDALVVVGRINRNIVECKEYMNENKDNVFKMY